MVTVLREETGPYRTLTSSVGDQCMRTELWSIRLLQNNKWWSRGHVIDDVLTVYFVHVCLYRKGKSYFVVVCFKTCHYTYGEVILLHLSLKLYHIYGGMFMVKCYYIYGGYYIYGWYRYYLTIWVLIKNCTTACYSTLSYLTDKNIKKSQS